MRRSTPTARMHVLPARSRAPRPGPFLSLLLLALVTLSVFAPAALATPSNVLSLDAVAEGPNVIVEAGDQATADRTLDLAEEGWRRLAGRFGAPPPGRVHIVVLNDEEYESVQPAPMTRGFATFGGNRIFLRGSQLDREVVVHELAHIFLGYTVRPGLDVPDWFNEGLAQYVSGAETPTITLIYEASAGNLLSLPNLSEVDALHGDNRQLATLQGLAVVQFLALEFGEAKLWDLVSNLSTARSFEHALFVTYGYSDIEIDERWAAYASDAYSLLSPTALRLLSTALIGLLALFAAAIWFIRRTMRLYGGDDPGLQPAEVQAARQAEDLLHHLTHPEGSGPAPNGPPTQIDDRSRGNQGDWELPPGPDEPV